MKRSWKKIKSAQNKSMLIIEPNGDVTFTALNDLLLPIALRLDPENERIKEFITILRNRSNGKKNIN